MWSNLFKYAHIYSEPRKTTRMPVQGTMQCVLLQILNRCIALNLIAAL